MIVADQLLAKLDFIKTILINIIDYPMIISKLMYPDSLSHNCKPIHKSHQLLQKFVQKHPVRILLPSLNSPPWAGALGPENLRKPEI